MTNQTNRSKEGLVVGLTVGMKQLLVNSLKMQRDEIDALIKKIEESEGSTPPAITTGVKHREAQGRSSVDRQQKSDDGSFQKCTIHAVTNILREGRDGEYDLSAADIMSELKRRWKINGTYRTVSVHLGKGKRKGLFEQVGDKWRLV